VNEKKIKNQWFEKTKEKNIFLEKSFYIKKFSRGDLNWLGPLLGYAARKMKTIYQTLFSVLIKKLLFFF